VKNRIHHIQQVYFILISMVIQNHHKNFMLKITNISTSFYPDFLIFFFVVSLVSFFALSSSILSVCLSRIRTFIHVCMCVCVGSIKISQSFFFTSICRINKIFICLFLSIYIHCLFLLEIITVSLDNEESIVDDVNDVISISVIEVEE
jgi:hypothetical protein